MATDSTGIKQQLDALSPRRKTVSDTYVDGLDPYFEMKPKASQLMLLTAYFSQQGQGSPEITDGSYYDKLYVAKNQHLDLAAYREAFGKIVLIHDLLDASYALDYVKEGGNPNELDTEIYKLIKRAKNYTKAENVDQASRDQLGAKLTDFLLASGLYKFVDAVVAMPSSKADSSLSLPRSLASQLSAKFELPDLSDALRTSQDRQQLKTLALAEKEAAIRNTLQCDSNLVGGKSILLLDDTFQSGISLNSAGALLRLSGATRIVGLCCEKTVRNDANKREANP